MALKKAGIEANHVDIVNMHATGTTQGDIQECEAVKQLFGNCPNVSVNATKGFIGHAMGAAGALELAGNIPSFVDGFVHPCKKSKTLIPNVSFQD